MTILRFRSPAGDLVAEVPVKPGQSFMIAALQANVPGIEAECGGALSCATCHVYVDEAYLAALPTPSDEETGMLGFVAAGRRPGSRLSCQLVGTEQLALVEMQLPDRQVG